MENGVPVGGGRVQFVGFSVMILVSMLLIAVVHLTQGVWHLAPCELCLQERQVHWEAAGAALIGLIILISKGKFAWVAGMVLVILYGYGVWLSTYHAGVEWKFWPGPMACTGGAITKITSKDIMEMMGSTTHSIVRCDEAAWRLLGISLAGWNAVVSALLAVIAMFVVYAGLRQNSIGWRARSVT